MKIFRPLAALIILALPALSQEVEPVSIFDGKTLKGWNIRKGEEKLWTVRDGMIVGGDMKNDVKQTTFIASDKSYQNFDLQLDLRFVEGTGFMNSGIQIRSLRRHDHEMIGYQIDAGVRWWGKIYDECRRNRPIATAMDQDAMMKAVKPYGWNRYRILCEGKRIRTWINGVPTIDYTEKAANIAEDGILGFQVHGGGAFEIQFKNITIKELPATAGAPTWKSIKDAQKKAEEEKVKKK